MHTHHVLCAPLKPIVSDLTIIHFFACWTHVLAKAVLGREKFEQLYTLLRRRVTGIIHLGHVGIVGWILCICKCSALFDQVMTAFLRLRPDLEALFVHLFRDRLEVIRIVVCHLRIPFGLIEHVDAAIGDSDVADLNGRAGDVTTLDLLVLPLEIRSGSWDPIATVAVSPYADVLVRCCPMWESTEPSLREAPKRDCRNAGRVCCMTRILAWKCAVSESGVLCWDVAPVGLKGRDPSCSFRVANEEKVLGALDDGIIGEACSDWLIDVEHVDLFVH